MFLKLTLFFLIVLFITNATNGQMSEYITMEHGDVNLRTGPGLDYSISEKLFKGQKLTLLNKDNDWFEVEDSSGNTGWVFSQLVSGPFVETLKTGWTCFRGDYSHSGLKKEDITSSGKIRWTISLNSEINFNSSPVISDGKIYLGGKNGNLFCIDENKGFYKVIISAEEPICSTPALKDNKIYFVTEDGILYSYDLSTKEKLWALSVGPGSGYSPIIDNFIYTVGRNNQILYALNPEDGKEKWKFSVKNNEILSSPSMGDDYIYVGSSEGIIYCLNKNDGLLMWKYNCNDCVGIILVSGNLIYAIVTRTEIVNKGDLKTFIYAIDVHSGEKKWVYDFNGQLFIPTIMENVIYTGTSDENICALDMFTGKEKWLLKEASYSFASVGNGNILYSALYNGNIFAFDVNLKKKLWSLQVDGIPLLPALFNGVVYIPTKEGKIYAIE